MYFAPVSLKSLLVALENGRATPRETIRTAVDRIDAIDGEIGAFAHRASAEALDAAASMPGPLAGIPIGFKDIFDTADMPTGYGSAIHAGFRPSADAALVAMARARGAAVLGKTTTTEFAFLEPARTKNPVHREHTPGGSSSGSAAAVASGMVAGAFGSQTAGSVIRPAAFCGIAGYKPSFRLLPTAGMKSFAWTLDTVGLFAKSVEDVALLADLVTGRKLRVEEAVEASELTIGLYRSHIDDRLDPAMAEALEAARLVMERAGARLVEITEPEEMAAARAIQPLIQSYEGAIAFAHERRVHEAALSDRLREALAEGASVPPARYDDARRTARRARRAVAPLFQAVDILLAPSALGAAPRTLASTGDPAMNRLWTLTGNPCVNVSGLTDPNGLPLGLSVVGRFGDDRRVLAASSLVERLLAER